MKTKQLLFWAGLLSCPVVSAQVEGFRSGTRLGFGESSLTSTRFSEDPKSQLHMQAGGVTIYGFNEWFSLRADLQLSYTSSTAKGMTENIGLFSGTYSFTDQYRFFSLSLPVGLRLGYPGKAFRPYAGMGIALQANLFGTETRTYDHNGVNDDHGYTDRKIGTLKPISQDFYYGIGAELGAGRDRAYFLEVRFYHPLNEIGTVDGRNLVLSYFSIGGGILFE